MKLETLLIHTGAEIDPSTGAVAPPIHLSTTYDHGADCALHDGHIYIRETNPTQSRLEEALAASEGGEAALFFASGLAACAAFLQSLPAGGHMLYPDDVYHGVREMAFDFLPRWGCTASTVDMGDLDAVAAAMRPETRLIWAETPSNPLLKVADLATLAKVAHAHGALLAVDNTFATPILQRPLDLGADVSIHSATKYMGGHSDVQGGALMLRERAPLYDALTHIRTPGWYCVDCAPWPAASSAMRPTRWPSPERSPTIRLSRRCTIRGSKHTPGTTSPGVRCALSAACCRSRCAAAETALWPWLRG